MHRSLFYLPGHWKTSGNFRYDRGTEGSGLKQDLPNPKQGSYPLHQEVPPTFSTEFIPTEIVLSHIIDLALGSTHSNTLHGAGSFLGSLVTQLIKNYPSLLKDESSWLRYVEACLSELGLETKLFMAKFILGQALPLLYHYR
jgi:hypothetical protein